MQSFTIRVEIDAKSAMLRGKVRKYFNQIVLE